MADKVRLEEENQYLRERSETETAVHGIIGNSVGIQHVLRSWGFQNATFDWIVRPETAIYCLVIALLLLFANPLLK